MKKRILSAFLALCLVLTLAPLTSLAAGSTMPGGTTDGDGVTTITLTEDVTLTQKWTVAKGSEVVLNLNGHKLSTNDKVTYTINVAGTLTVIDDSTGTAGEVNNGHPTASTIDVANDGKLILGDQENPANNNFIIENSGNKTSNQNSAIKVEEKGTLIVNGGTVKGPKTPENNYRSIQTFGTTTINGGTFAGEVQVWTWAENGTTFPSSLTIEGGQFKDTVAICNTEKANASYPFEGTLNINGGDFTHKDGDEGYVIGIQVPADREEPKDAKAEISGGTFDAPVEPKYLADDLKFQAKTENGIYSYHTTQELAEAAAGPDGSVSKKAEGSGEMEPIVKVKGAGFIWDIKDTAAKQAVTELGGTVGADWIDQTMYVVLDRPLGAGNFGWISVELDGKTWGCACVGDDTHKTYAFSFLNLGQIEQKPADASAEGLPGAVAINASVSVYKTPTQQGVVTPGDTVDVSAFKQIGETKTVEIPKKPTNQNPNLKIASVQTDAPLYAKVQVTGMESDKVYAIRIATTPAQKTDMVIFIVDNATQYEFYTQANQKIWVLEFPTKADIKPGDSLHTSIATGESTKITQ